MLFFLFFLSSCGLQILEKGLSGSFDNGAYNFSGSNVGNGIINNTSAIWQWDFNYQDENGETAHCLTQFAANSATPVYSAGVPENCRLYTLSGTLQNPISTPSIFIHGSISSNACLQIKDAVTGEILFASTCVKVSGSIPQANCSSSKPAGIVYSEIGSGTAASPYQIFSGAQLRSISTDTSALSKHFIQCDHIDLTGVSQFKIGDDVNSFTGSYDGAGYKIKNYSYIDLVAQRVGLFGQASNAQFKNIYLQASTIDADSLVGALVGMIVDGATVSNVLALDLNLKASGVSLGGISVIGGVVGVAEQGTYIDLRSSGQIDSLGMMSGGVLGIVGQSFSGLYSATVNRISSSTTINGQTMAGGAIGGAGGTTIIENSFATGNVSTIINDESDAGGFIGSTNEGVLIRHCYATGNVSGGDAKGGLVGRMVAGGGEIHDSYATGNVSCSDNFTGICEAGGLVGRATGGAIIRRSFALGNVTANSAYVGGLLGYAGDGVKNTEITDSFALGNVTVTTATNGVGGLVGTFEGISFNKIITRSFSASKIIAAADSDGVGGLVGSLINNSNLTIENSFAVNDTITGLVGVGEFIGDDSGASGVSVTNNFYYSGVVCTAACNGNYATPKSSKNYFYSKTNAPLNAWDFAAVWKEVAGSFPLLQ